MQIEIKKSAANKVVTHTMTAAMSTLDCYGTHDLTDVLSGDLKELQKLEASPIVDAAIRLVQIAIDHEADPRTETHTKARVARDELGDFLIDAREVRG
ncbi:hypothetical protein [Sporosarcina sp. A2]|uniref:hypothetical protein n=1 Tax=Sporosarcina sp. A2 TaxID=3393449 RepID=UPI003D7BF793